MVIHVGRGGDVRIYLVPEAVMETKLSWEGMVKEAAGGERGYSPQLETNSPHGQHNELNGWGEPPQVPDRAIETALPKVGSGAGEWLDS